MPFSAGIPATKNPSQQFAKTGFRLALAAFLTRPQAETQIGADLKIKPHNGFVNRSGDLLLFAIA
jgi:hypothetical protein